MPNNPRMGGHVPPSATDPGVGGVAIDYSTIDQNLPTPGRGLHINTTGTLMLILIDDADGPGLPYYVKAGAVYGYAVRRIMKLGSSGASGNILY
jgi:hypothetical protein